MQSGIRIGTRRRQQRLAAAVTLAMVGSPLVMIGLTPQTAAGADQTWLGDFSSNNPQNLWNSPNWSPGPGWDNVAVNSAILAPLDPPHGYTGPTLPIVNADIAVVLRAMQIEAGYTINGVANPTNPSLIGSLTLTNGGSGTLGVGEVQTTLGTATINAVVGGSVGLDKTGAAKLVLANTANTYSGGTTVSAGELEIDAEDSLGSNGNSFAVARR
jgi:autotransporter-associated beta strand protein